MQLERAQKASGRYSTTIRRRPSEEIYEDPQQHLWAISYSDLLMVMMAFFVLFFNFEDKSSPDALMDRIRLSFIKSSGDGPGGGNGDSTLKADRAPGSTGSASATGPGAGAGAGAGTSDGKGFGANLQYTKGIANATTVVGLPPNIIEQLKETGVQFREVKADKNLVVDFPDDFYPVGKYDLGGKRIKDVERVLKILDPFKEHIALTFIGHTDETRFMPGQNKILASNLVLSSLRAARAVETALLMGFDPKHVSPKGLAEHARATRSLSLQIDGRKR